MCVFVDPGNRFGSENRLRRVVRNELGMRIIYLKRRLKEFVIELAIEFAVVAGAKGKQRRSESRDSRSRGKETYLSVDPLSPFRLGMRADIDLSDVVQNVLAPPVLVVQVDWVLLAPCVEEDVDALSRIQ